jgi:hypothetical protein
VITCGYPLKKEKKNTNGLFKKYNAHIMPTSMGIVFFGGGHYAFLKAHQPIMLFKATYNYIKK